MAIGLRPLPENGHYAVPGYSTPHREPMARHAGRDDTLHPDPAGVGTHAGYMGRDITQDSQPYNEGRGMFSRLHEGAS
jgi:hypothetical protein